MRDSRDVVRHFWAGVIVLVIGVPSLTTAMDRWMKSRDAARVARVLERQVSPYTQAPYVPSRPITREREEREPRLPANLPLDKQEEIALERMERAKWVRQISNGRPASADALLQSIIDDFPATEAAKEAAELLAD